MPGEFRRLCVEKGGVVPLLSDGLTSRGFILVGLLVRSTVFGVVPSGRLDLSMGGGKLLDLRVGRKNPPKLTQLSSRSHPRHLMGKRTAQKDTIIDITSDSQVNSNFPNRWPPASLTFNNYFYLFLSLYIT